MEKYLVISIDVEPDCTPGWNYSDPLTFRGVSEGIGKRLQPLFNKYDACPTYLINNVVLEDKASTSIFMNLEGKFELGTHLHSEFIEPEKKFTDYAGKKAEANQCFLAPDVEEQKMKNITRLFETSFGAKPTSFRAGRFSAGSNTIQCLQNLGYLVDSSVTPHVIWNDKSRQAAVSYSHAPEQPYFLREGAYPEPDSAGMILEVPVSIVLSRQLFRRKALWLRPALSDMKDFLRIIKTQSKTHENNDCLVFNMMFHNVEVLPGMSPYTRSEADCSAYLQSIDDLLAFCKTSQIRSTGLTSLYDKFKRR